MKINTWSSATNKLLMGISGYIILIYILTIPPVFRHWLTEAQTDLRVLMDMGYITDTTFAVAAVGFHLSLLLMGVWLAASIHMNAQSHVSANLAATSIIGIIATTQYPQTYPDWLVIPTVVSICLTIFVIVSYAITMPDGHFSPRWTIGLPLIVPLVMPPLYFMTFFDVFEQTAGIILINIIRVLVVLCLGILIYRYYRHVSPTQRQQMKWIIIGATIYGGSIIGAEQFYLVRSMDFILENPTMLIVADLLEDFVLRWFPVCTAILVIALSVKERRLYDVDLIANRFFVNSAVFITLGLLYFATANIIVQTLGASNLLFAYVVGLVAPFSLFTPINRHIQRFVDSRLFRLRYDINQIKRFQQMHNTPVKKGLTRQTFGGYRLLKRIGRGGMGEVYRVTDEAGHDIALKLISSMYLDDTGMRERFEREIEILYDLDHPSIASIVDSGVIDGTPYFAMEYIEGDSLETIIDSAIKIPISRAVEIISDVAVVLTYIHNRGLVHRDVKPANIMVKADNRVVLLDFGVAMIVNATLQTETGAVGTLAYMAPEQIAGTSEIDARTDVYALGVVCFELLSGQSPFTGKVANLLFAHLHQPVPDLCDLRADVPEHIRDAVSKALEKDPDDRFETVEAFARAIRGI